MSDLRWKCNPGPQREFVFGELGRIREVLYGGQKGGGKSDAIGPKCYKHIGENPGAARVLILRETHPELTELIDRMRPQCLAQGAVWHEQRKTWTFPCGAKIRFGHLSDGCDPYWGLEFSLIIVDEVTRCIATEADYIKLLGSLRNSKGVPCQVVLMSNPGGKGHAWVKARFMGVPPRTVYADPETGLERVFIPASLNSNPHLPESYRQTLMQLPEAERDAYLNGNWDAFEGRIFKLLPGVHIWSWAQFNERNKLAADNRAIPDDWLRYRTYDHGFARPGACYWYAVDHEGRAYVYRELYTVARDSKGGFVADEGAKLPPRDVARMIREYSEGERYAANWTGPDLFNEVRQDQAGGVKIATHFEAEGIHFQAWHAGDGSRVAGKQALHQRLSFESGEEGSPLTWPGLVILDGTAPHLCRTLPALEYSKQRPEIWDKASEDHCLAGDTIVHTTHGFAPISDLVGTTGQLISFDGERATVRDYFDCRKTQENVEVYAVRFTDGREVVATANHPFLTVSGEWIRVDGLAPGIEVRSVGVIQSGAYADCEVPYGYGRKPDDSGVSGGSVLPVRDVLPAQGEAPAPRGVGVAERPGSEGDAHPPQGPRQGEQPARELGVCASRGAFVAPLGYTGGEGTVSGECGQARCACGAGVALDPRGEGVALAEREEGCCETHGSYADLHAVRAAVHDARPEAGEVLLSEVRGPGSGSQGRDSSDDAGAEGGSRPQGVGYATVKEVVYVGRQDVYNLEVAGTHCFAVNGGLVVHNCADSVTGFCKMNPWSPVKDRRGEAGRFLDQHKPTGGAHSWMLD